MLWPQQARPKQIPPPGECVAWIGGADGRRGLTQAALAAAVGITQPCLAQIEAGQRTGDVRLYARLAETLRVRMEDLVAEED